MRSVIIVISILLFFTSCSQEKCRDVEAIERKQVSVQVERLEAELFQMKTEEEFRQFLRDYPAFTDLFLDGNSYPSDSLLANKLFNLVTGGYLDSLYHESENAFEDFDPIKEDFEQIFGKLQTLYPNLKTPVVQTVVTGLYSDLFISDSLIIIGIDYFIGDDATYRPANIPGYILRRYNAAHLPAIIAKFMAGSMVETGNSNTLLSEMVDFGKTYYLTSRLLPCTADSLLLGYTTEEMDLITDNEPVIWANFVENEILYETSHVTKQKFVGERPNVHEIHQKCPGRIGAWVGWQIVESYMERNNVSIQELLAETDNEKIFSKSGYKPQG